MLSPAALAGFALFWFPAHRRRRIVLILLTFSASVLLFGAVGCTTVKAPYSSLAPGTYTILVIATNSLTQDKQSANLIVVITQ